MNQPLGSLGQTVQPTATIRPLGAVNNGALGSGTPTMSADQYQSAAPAAAPPTSPTAVGRALDATIGVIGKAWDAVANFFGRMFGGGNPTPTHTANLPAAAPAIQSAASVPVAPAPTPSPTADMAPLPQGALVAPTAPVVGGDGPQPIYAPAANASGLSPQELALAQQQGILATRANFDAFMRDAQGLEAINALGPGSTDMLATRELQTILAGWGYPVQVTGQWDQNTTAALLRFKQESGLVANYATADGNRAFHPFIDDPTKQAMIARLQVQPVQNPAYQPVAPVQPQYVPQPQPQPAPFQPQPAPFQPQPAPFQPQPAPFQPQPAPFQPQPAPFQPQPAPFQPQPAPFQPQPAPYQPQPSPYAPPPQNFPPAPPPPPLAPPPPPPPPIAPPPPLAPPLAPPGYGPAANGLTAEEAQMAAAQGIEPSRANFDAFIREAKGLEAINALGPGSTDPNSIRELQQLLAAWGFQVGVNGQWDQATTAAVIQFKRASNLGASYRMADGSPGVHPFIDDQTKRAMIARLEGQQPQPQPYAPQPQPYAPQPQPYAPQPQPNPYQPAPVQPQYVPQPPAVNPAAANFTPQEAELVQAQGLLPTRENLTSFLGEARLLEAANAMGPGTQNPQAIGELQQLLASWGLPVQATGQWDQATTDAMLSFKRASGLFAPYRLADGTVAIHPFVDEPTKNAMRARLGQR